MQTLQPPHTNSGRLETRRETSDRLKVSIETLKRWEKSGRITPVRVGPKLIRYRAEEIASLLK